MTTPKHKECPTERCERLALGKPHIFWNRDSAEWLAAGARLKHGWGVADFCLAQDERWTPREMTQ